MARMAMGDGGRLGLEELLALVSGTEEQAEALADVVSRHPDEWADGFEYAAFFKKDCRGEGTGRIRIDDDADVRD